MAPRLLMCLVSALVSIPERPMTPWRSRKSSRLSEDLQFERTGEISLTTKPSTQGRRDSMSSAFAP